MLIFKILSPASSAERLDGNMFKEKKGEYSSNLFLSFYRKSIKYYRKVLFFRAGKGGNMLLPVRRKNSQIKTPNILDKNVLRPFSS